MRKEGGAILKSVNPAVKSAYKQVKDKGKQAYKDLRSKIQNNNTSNSYQSNNTQLKISSNYMMHKPNSEPSSPTLSSRTGIKKSISGTVIGKTDKTVTYVRESKNIRTDQNLSKSYNGFDTTSSNGLSVSSHSSSSSANRLAPEASPEVSDVDSDHSHEMLTFNRIDMDLMGELKDYIHKRSSIDESSNSNKSNNSQSSSTSNLTNNSSNNALSLIAKPIPPPRSQLTRKLKPIADENSKEVPLIELDTPPDDVKDKNNIIFDPLFETTDSKQRPLSMNNWIPSTNSNQNSDFNTLILTPNCSNNSLSSSLNPVNTFGLSSNRERSSLYFGGQGLAQTSALSLSLTNTNQTTTDSFNDMINWSSSPITSGSQNVNLIGPLPIPTQSRTSSNPFKTKNWQHFD